MTTTTTRNLAREVAVALVNVGKLKREMMQEGYYNELLGNGVLVNHRQDTWITILDGDEVGWELHPDYPNDLNACARDLTVLGWEFELGTDLGQWVARYRYKGWGQMINARADNPAVAWCEAFLALQKYVEGKDSNHD